VTEYGDGVSLKERGIRGKAMEIVGAVVVLFLFSIPILAIFLLLLFVALKFLQLSCYSLAWLCIGLGRLCELLFERKQPRQQPLLSTQEGSKTYSANI
jgi:hypothetical protein